MANFIYILILVFAVVAHDLVQERLGCFKMRNKGKRFSLCGYQNTFHSLTVRQCNTLCFTKGYTHAATKNGHECHCGDVEDALPNPVNETDCNVNCAGDPGSMCGGRRAFSLYSTGIIEEPLDDAEIGCLTDGGDLRLIKEHKIDLQLTNSPARCVAYCRALGYRHAGVQYTFECYCGEAERVEPLTTGCDLACVTDEDLKCGGNWKMNVYYTGINTAGPAVQRRGCYEPRKDYKSRKLSTLTPYKCVAECLRKLFPYASLLNGTECICSKRKETKKVDTDLCNVPCSGEPGVSCGGEKHVESFSTGLVGDVVLGKLVGCFKAEAGDLVKGHNLALGAQNSAGYCITRCLELGYAFAGVRNTYDCICAEDAPKRLPVTIRPDVQCEYPCLSVQTENCGSNNNEVILLYRTGLDTARKNCIKSSSIVKGENACIGQKIFEDTFDKDLNLTKWQPTQQISGEDNEFVIYSKKTISVENGKLIIRPRVLNPGLIRSGNITLSECTGSGRECSSFARSHQILPPVESGQVCSRKSFAFKYGRVTITARLPSGDWVYPQLWLKPVTQNYGPDYLSGKVVIALARGNANLRGPDGLDLSSTQVFSSLLVSKSPRSEVVSLPVRRNSPDPWHKHFHNYTLIWSEDAISISIDSSLDLKNIYSVDKDKSLLQAMGLQDSEIWQFTSKISPFDQEFYVCLGVGVGGATVFPDSSSASSSSSSSKPWVNHKVKGMLHFYKDMENWKKTWNEDTKLEVDSITVQAI